MPIINKVINKETKEDIKNVIVNLDNEKVRKRAYAGLLALNTLINYLNVRDIHITKKNNCYNNPLILNEFDVADIKLDNNIRIDVRSIVGNSYPQMWIP